MEDRSFIHDKVEILFVCTMTAPIPLPPQFYSVGTQGYFCGRSAKLILRSRMSESITPFPHTFSWHEA
jgi:hypothetical protein